MIIYSSCITHCTTVKSMHSLQQFRISQQGAEKTGFLASQKSFSLRRKKFLKIKITLIRWFYLWQYCFNMNFLKTVPKTIPLLVAQAKKRTHHPTAKSPSLQLSGTTFCAHCSLPDHLTVSLVYPNLRVHYKLQLQRGILWRCLMSSPWPLISCGKQCLILQECNSHLAT